MDDLISRQAALKICRRYWHPTYNPIMEEIEKLPSAQSERDTPIKPEKEKARLWNIVTTQAVCPKCGYYITPVMFVGDGKGKRVSYCETCGQAIDWEGWDYDG